MELWRLAMSLAYVDRTHRFYLQLGSCSNSTNVSSPSRGGGCRPAPDQPLDEEGVLPPTSTRGQERARGCGPACGGSPSPTPADAADYTAGPNPYVLRGFHPGRRAPRRLGGASW
jgi:hypothetical protein